MTMGTALAIDCFVTRIVKQEAKSLNGKDLAAHRNRKGFWGLIVSGRMGFKYENKVHLNRLSLSHKWFAMFLDCKVVSFSMQQTSARLCTNIVANVAYFPVASECNNWIMTPFCQH